MQTMERLKKPQKKKAKWSSTAEELLCELWLENIGGLRSVRKNRHIFQAMSAEMAKRGFLFSSEEIHMKINNLTGRYRKEKMKVGSFGGSPSEWPLYYTVHAILGRFKVRKVEFLPEESIATDSCAYDDPIGMYSPGSSKEVLSNIFPTTPNIPPNSESPRTSGAQTFPKTSSISADVPLPDFRPDKFNKKESIRMNILVELKKARKQMEEQMKEERANNQKLHANDEKIIAIEERRNDLLQELIQDSRTFQTSLLSFLKTK